MTSLKRWRYPVVVVGALGVLTASNRTVVVSSGALAALLLLRHVRIDVRRAGRAAAVILVAVGATVLVLQSFLPSVVSSRAQFLGLSLNPASGSSELSTRAPGYVTYTARSIGYGGTFGRGLGSQSLGRQYIRGATPFQSFYEGGFVTVAVETGLIGLVVWITWTSLWVRRLWGLARTAPAEIAGAVATIAGAVMMLWFVNFWPAIAAVQDYVANAAVFFSCGLAVALAAGNYREVAPVPSDHRVSDGIAN
jgi:cell division protein FtsW (lipid II flippase)